ncbi:MAG: hypothetical protein LBF78_06830 [Treponema sp.]|jgi:hypothetical protein|nr:hypothetical protein [Treponema sp.]
MVQHEAMNDEEDLFPALALMPVTPRGEEGLLYPYTLSGDEDDEDDIDEEDSFDDMDDDFEDDDFDDDFDDDDEEFDDEEDDFDYEEDVDYDDFEDN